MKFTSEQIQQLLAEKITGTIDADDDLALEQLLTENKEVLLQWQAIQQQIHGAEAQGFSMEADAEKSWQQIAPLMEKPGKARVFSLVKIAIAAAILTAIFSALYLFNKDKASVQAVAKLPAIETKNAIALSMDNGETIYLKKAGTHTFQLGTATIKTNENIVSYTCPESATQSWSTLSVPATADYKIVLSDGTEVWMNSQTKLHFPLSFPGKTREVYIDGEAYFKVTKNMHQPFIVHTPQTAIKVLGTQFNVNTYDANKIQTALVHGSVTVTIKNKQVNLKPGFGCIYSALHQGLQVETFDKSEILSWMKGVYYFHNMQLKDLSKLLSRWYNVRVQFKNSALENKTFSGNIVKNQPIQLFLDNIKISNEINASVKNGVVYFR